MRRVRILPEVVDDVNEAARHYDDEGHPGLGDRFTATFYSYISQLQETIISHRLVYSDFSRIYLRPFPYALYYRLHENVLVVSLVIHASREPQLVESLLRGSR